MKKRILVVDDEVESCEAIRDVLRDKYEVFSAHDGIAAIAEVEKNNPDLVIVDYDMPELDGVTATERILKDKRHEGIKFILLSAYLHGKRVQDWIAMVQQPVLLQKPCDIEELERAIAALLAG